jgi:hypothetical protein
MDVQLPDGTILRGIPDGTSKADILAKLQANGRDVSWAKTEAETPAPATSAAAPASAPYRPTRAPSSASAAAMPQGNTLNYLGETASNIGPDILNVVGGLEHAILNPSQTINNLGDIAAGGIQAGASAILPQGAMDYLNSSNPEASARAAQAWENFKQHYVDSYGTLEGAAESFRQRPVSTLMDASMVFGGGGALARGANMPRTANVLSAAESATNPLNALRPVGIVAEQAPGYINRLLNTKNAAYLKAAEGNAPAIISALEANRPVTPGASFTAAEAAARESGTMFPALQKKVEEFAPTLYADQAAANEAARQAALGTFAKTPEELKSATETRKANAERGYTEAGRESIIADPALEDLINKSTSIEKAIREATSIGKDVEATGGMPFSLTRGTPATEAVPGKIVPAPEGSKIKRVKEPDVAAAEAVPTEGSIADLHTVQMALKDMMGEAEGGIKGYKAKSIGEVRKQLVNWMENNSEKYAAVKQQFIKDSTPINEMKIGQDLQSSLRGELGVGERAGAFDTAVENAPSTIKKATGSPIFKTLEQAIGADNTAIVMGVQKDLAQEALALRRAKEGAGKGLNVPSVQESIRPGLNAIADLAERVYRKLAGHVSQKVARAIAEEMISPTATASALKEALAYEKTQNALRSGMQTVNKNVNALARGGMAANETDRQRLMYRP